MSCHDGLCPALCSSQLSTAWPGCAGGWGEGQGTSSAPHGAPPGSSPAEPPTLHPEAHTCPGQHPHELAGKGWGQTGCGAAGRPDGGHGLAGLHGGDRAGVGASSIQIWLQLIWNHLQRNVCQANYEGQRAWGTLLPPAGQGSSAVAASIPHWPLAAAGLAVTPCPQCGWGPPAGSGGGRLPGSLPHPELQRSLGPLPAHRPGAGWLRNSLLGSGLICSSPPTGRPHPTLPAGSQAPKCPNRPILRPEHGSQGPLSPKNLPRCEFPWEGTGLAPKLLGPLPFALSAGGGGKAGHFKVPCGRWGCQPILRTDPDILD